MTQKKEPPKAPSKLDMNGALSELEQLAEKVDVDISYDTLSGEGTAGGICKVKGRWRVIVDRRMSPTEKVSLLARCLARFDVEDHFVSPAVRQIIEQSRPISTD